MFCMKVIQNICNPFFSFIIDEFKGKVNEKLYEKSIFDEHKKTPPPIGGLWSSLWKKIKKYKQIVSQRECYLLVLGLSYVEMNGWNPGAQSFSLGSSEAVFSLCVWKKLLEFED